MNTDKKLQSIEKKADELQEKIENESIAMHLLREQKKSAKRWFVVWLITFLTLLGIVAGILYLFFTSDIKIVSQDGTGINNFIGNDGDIYNGATSDYNKTKKS